MTEDYKKNILNYITNMVNQTAPTTDEIFKEVMTTNRSDWTNYLPSGWVDFHFEGVLQEKNSGNLILYGGYRATGSTGINNEVYGIIILLDDNFKPIKSFFEYKSGTKIRYIQKLVQADDNSFYMVDDTNFAFGFDDTILSSTKRLVMLNNFAAKTDDEYELLLRSSYKFPNSYNVFKCENLAKNPNQAQYVMVGKIYEDGGNNYLGVAQIELNIPYGSSVQWSKKNIISYVSTYTQNVSGEYLSSFIKFNDDKYKVNLLCGYFEKEISGGSTTTNQYIRIYSKNYNSSSYSYTNILTNPELTGASEYLENQSVFISEDLCYFVLDNINNPYSATYNLKIQLWGYNISNSTLNKIYEKSYGTGQPAHQEQIFLSINQGELYIENIINKTNNKADYYVQRYGGEWNPILVSENQLYVWNQRSFFVSNSFNLIKMFLYPVNPRNAVWYFPIVKENYNPLNYNGEPYIDYNSAVPHQAEVYSNNSLVFARNLYNLTTNANQSNATVVVPNSYLNDMYLTSKNLLSETNSEIVVDTNTTTKNIYETLYLNFINTTNVINEDTNDNYPLAAAYITENINTGTQENCETTTVGKIRLNKDGSSEIREIYWETIDDTHKQTTIGITMTESVLSIDFISNDETTIYSTIDTSNLEVGNTYNITQSLRIE